MLSKSKRVWQTRSHTETAWPLINTSLFKLHVFVCAEHQMVNIVAAVQILCPSSLQTGLTPLMEAASGGYHEVGRVLISKVSPVLHTLGHGYLVLWLRVCMWVLTLVNEAWLMMYNSLPWLHSIRATAVSETPSAVEVWLQQTCPGTSYKCYWGGTLIASVIAPWSEVVLLLHVFLLNLGCIQYM